LVERLVRNEKVRGSTPLGSTTFNPNSLNKVFGRVATSGGNKFGKAGTAIGSSKIHSHRISFSKAAGKISSARASLIIVFSVGFLFPTSMSARKER
jgi:hypothetical protein